jgi:hypothetical protein
MRFGQRMPGASGFRPIDAQRERMRRRHASRFVELLGGLGWPLCGAGHRLFWPFLRLLCRFNGG